MSKCVCVSKLLFMDNKSRVVFLVNKTLVCIVKNIRCYKIHINEYWYLSGSVDEYIFLMAI